MITDGKKWHYLSVINLSALFKEKLSNCKGVLYCLNWFNSYTRENKPKENEEICNHHDSYHIEMPKQAEKMLEYIHGEKSLKALFTINLDLECLLKKEQPCQNNPENFYTEKYMSLTQKAIHEPSGWTMFTSCSFDEKENKLNYYSGKYVKKLKNVKKACNENN